MNIQDQAVAALEAARTAAILEKLFRNLAKCRFDVEHVERRRGDRDWICYLSARGPKGEVVRGLALAVLTPTPMNFEASVTYDMFGFCPHWVYYYAREGTYVFPVHVGGDACEPRRPS